MVPARNAQEQAILHALQFRTALVESFCLLLLHVSDVGEGGLQRLSEPAGCDYLRSTCVDWEVF
jgi:hypothetical protein